MGKGNRLNGGAKMNKQRFLVIINMFLGVLLLSQIATVFLMGSIGYNFTEAFHEVNGFVIFGLIIVHMTLNWPWIKKAAIKRCSFFISRTDWRNTLPSVFHR